MANREITVIINGQEFVSKAAKQAGDGMDEFSGKVGKWVAAGSLVVGAFVAIKEGAQALFNAAMSAIGAYDEFAASNSRMAAQSKITGVALAEMEALAKRLRAEFGVGRVAANELAVTVAQYTALTNNAITPNKLLARAVDLGAASKMSAVEVSEALQAAMRGEDSGFDKLLKKNPSALWQEYADKQGIAVGKMSDAEKRLAELTAIMEAGNKVAGAAAELAGTGAGKQQQLNEKWNDAKVAAGQALQPVRIFMIQGLSNLADIAGNVVLAMARVTNAIGVLFAGAVELGRSVVGGFAVAIGKLTGNTELEAWGTKQADAFGDFLTQMRKLEKQYLLNGEEAEKSAEKQQAATVKTSTVDREELEKRAKAHKKFADEVSKETERLQKLLDKSFEDSAAAAVKAGRATRDAFGDALNTTMANAGNAITRIRDSLRAAGSAVPHDEFRRLDDQSKGYLDTLKLMNQAHEVTRALDNGLPKAEGITRLQSVVDLLADQAATEFTITGNAEDHRKRLELIEQLKKRVRELTRDQAKAEGDTAGEAAKQNELKARLAENVANIARSALDAARAFGVVDDRTLASLNSAINIGNALAKIATSGFSFQNVTGVISGVASIVSSMMAGDQARRELLKQNNQRLAELRDGLDELSVDVTGDQVGKATSALSAFVPNMKTGFANWGSNMMGLSAALRAQGMTMGDLMQIADRVGIGLKDKDGNFRFEAVPQLLEFLKGMGTVGFGQGFGDRLNATTQGFNITGTSEADQLTQLAGLGGEFSSALRGVVNANDLAGSRTRLAALFAKLQRGELTSAELGGLTGSQFLNLVTDLIGRIDRLQQNASTGTGAGAGSGTGGTGAADGADEMGGGGESLGMSTETVQQVIQTMDAALSNILTEHTALHARVAAATEGSYQELQTLNTKVERLIAVTDGRFGRLDAELAAARTAASLAAGAGPVF